MVFLHLHPPPGGRNHIATGTSWWYPSPPLNHHSSGFAMQRWPKQALPPPDATGAGDHDLTTAVTALARGADQ
jgi:hypothetical protein